MEAVPCVPCLYNICCSVKYCFAYNAAVPRCRQAKELEARKASLGKWKLDLLHKLMDTLDLQRGSGDKVSSWLCVTTGGKQLVETLD